MNIAPVSNQTSTTQLTSSDQLLGKDSFLKMLVTQMRYQDPLNPLTDTQFIAQLSQFSSLEQLQNLNSNFQSSMLLSQSLHNSMAVNMIGRQVKFYGSTLSLQKGSPVDIAFDLQADSAETIVKITDESGKLIRELNVGARGAGTIEIAWDGKNNNGALVESGAYLYQVEAKSSGGGGVTVAPYSTGKVTGIKYQDGVAILMLGKTEVRLGEVIEVMASE